jgi:hypothetical protein
LRQLDSVVVYGGRDACRERAVAVTAPFVWGRRGESSHDDEDGEDEEDTQDDAQDDA